MRKFIFLCALCASTLMAFAEDTRTVITECRFTGWYTGIIEDGITYGRTGNDVISSLHHALTPAEGAVYHMTPTMSKIGKWDDEKYDYKSVTDEQITPGYYYFWTQLRIDGENGSLYRLPDNYEDLTVYVDGQKWNVYTTTSVESTYSYVWIASPVYPIGGVPVLKENGNLTGQFSVSADKQVRFAFGNLQFNKYWAWWGFAEHQYDIIGGDNASIDKTNDEDRQLIDLFGWGTGYNPTKYSTTDSEYADFNDWGPVAAEDMSLDSTWRTLTADEWDYLLNTRDNAANLHSLAIVNGQKGLVILPDNWDFSQTILKLEPQAGEDDIIINARKWDQWWEMAGAVFLPCAGMRMGIGIYAVNSYGFYWSSSAANETQAYSVRLRYPEGSDMFNLERSKGASVRLVQDVTEAPEAIDNTPFPSGEGRGEAHKRIVNGQLLIERNGRMYNAQGTQVK